MDAYPRELVNLIFDKVLWPACNVDEEIAFDKIIEHASLYQKGCCHSLHLT